ncbi:NIPSNAP family protein [Chloroflexota bacterium]
MVYEHRTYDILPGKMAEFVDDFGNIIVPLFDKYGVRLVGAWQVTIGKNNEFIYILGFESLNEREKFWKDLKQDEEFRKYQQGGARTAYVTSKILQPTSYSPLK